MKFKYLSILLFIFPGIALGHHSRAEFTDQGVSLQGVLTEVVWKNPHVALFLEVETGDGETQNWRLEGPTNLMTLRQTGVDSELFEVGQQMTAVGEVSRLREAIQVTNILLADGTEVIMDPSAAPRWNGPRIGGSLAAPEQPAIATDNLGFFRAWYPVGNPMMILNRFDYRDEALAARSDWDLVDNPIVRCEQPGMPVPIFHPQPVLFTEMSANLIGLRHGYFDTQRIVHMNQDMNAETQSASHLGFSKGRWEDDHTLVVETSRINYPYFDFHGTAQSEAIRVIERYSMSADMTRLDFEVRVEDPATLSEAATASWHFLALDKEFSAYECNPF